MRAFVAGWGEPGRDEVAALLVTELVTNALLHARSGPEVTARLDGGRLRVEVTDDSPTPPVRHRRSPRTGTGLGMILVDELASAWGAEPAGTGKVVWFELEAGSDPGRGEHDRRHLAPATEARR